MSEKERLQKHLELCGDDRTFEEIVIIYMAKNYRNFPITRILDFVNELNKEFVYPDIKHMEHGIEIIRERALYLKTYIEGDMYTTEETAKECAPLQAGHAQKIINICDGKD